MCNDCERVMQDCCERIEAGQGKGKDVVLEAWAKLYEKSYERALTDLEMGKMQGLELAMRANGSL